MNRLGLNYANALRLRYESNMEEARANLELYFSNLSAIGEHSDLMAEQDKWLGIYADNQSKLEALNALYKERIINGQING